MSSREIAFCLAEDRPDYEIGLRLAVLSLSRCCPGAPVYVYRPTLDGEFARWACSLPQVIVIPKTPTGASRWNCKPQALKPLFAEGYHEILWLDSDILITRDCRKLFTTLDESVLAVAQEPISLPRQGTKERTRGWNLEVGRSVPFSLNSSVVRVTRHHLPLLDRWTEFLFDPRYQSAQNLALGDRPLHMAGDQDVLNALLGGREFANIPLRVLGSGVDIVHAGGGLGYSVLERLRGASKPQPTFLHAAAGKPWLWLGGAPYWSQRNFFSWHRRLLQELSPYVYESRQYDQQLGMNSHWMYRRTTTGTFLRALGCGHFALRGLPLTMAATVISSISKTPKEARL
jgi:hypothetical protein